MSAIGAVDLIRERAGQPGREPTLWRVSGYLDWSRVVAVSEEYPTLYREPGIRDVTRVTLDTGAELALSGHVSEHRTTWELATKAP